MTEKTLDLVTLGRSSVDLYGEQQGGRLEDVKSFAKYVGGCPTNIAVGTARLGLKSALITRVGDEQLGRFIVETLATEGVETSQITSDPERLTALVILGIRDRDTFPHIFYRSDCADMAIGPEQIDGAFIARCKALLVSGTHLSQPGVEAASKAAIAHARAAGTKVVFDIDYRPVLWGLTGHAAGENRYIADDTISRRLQAILPDCDLVVGTEEEIHIAGGVADTREALLAIRGCSDAVLVVKRGAEGCIVFDAEIPEDLTDGVVQRGKPVQVFNTLGAGDGFMSGFLYGWLRERPLEECAELGNAVGALVVSRHGCAPAMPSREELEHYRRAWSLDRTLDRLHRVTTRIGDWPEVTALALDHRIQLEQLADRHGLPHSRIAEFKLLVAEALERVVGDSPAAGALVDDRYGESVLARWAGRGWWLARPVELPGARPLAFEFGPNPGLALRSWPREQIAKCLVFYHPQDGEGRPEAQEALLLQLQEACAGNGNEFLLEVLPPEAFGGDPAAVPDALEALYAKGIAPDWWKLPPSRDPAVWRRITEVISAQDGHCRGFVILGQSVGAEALKASFDAAAGSPLCRGFAVGRSIFQKAAESWFAGETEDAAAVEQIAANYAEILALWRDRRPA